MGEGGGEGWKEGEGKKQTMIKIIAKWKFLFEALAWFIML